MKETNRRAQLPSFGVPVDEEVDNEQPTMACT